MAKRSFHKELILNKWVLSLFDGGTLAALKVRLGADRFEGIGDDGQTKFYSQLQHSLFSLDYISEQDLRRYDLNVVKHWLAITEQRNKNENTILNMKYFQYLSLLFTEIYLDWYFNKKNQLIENLNSNVKVYNESQKEEDQFENFDLDDLNKIAFWNATGSGKTLLLHVNILQYLSYFKKATGKENPDKIILLTPNEGLSRQHLEELQLSGFDLYRLFDKNSSTTFNGMIEVIDINKLADEMGDKTVAVEAFEGNNLVLVDEGHRGTGTAAGAWMARREALVRGGFAFEYSATFGQAVAKGLTIKKSIAEFKKKKTKMLFPGKTIKSLADDEKLQIEPDWLEKKKAKVLATREIYAKCILFDYSYKYFYEDGYGKESLILNLSEKLYEKENIAGQYFTACLLSFYQQLFLWNKNGKQLSEFNIEKPLWVFVGNTVSGENSDVLDVLKHIAVFLNKEKQAKSWIKDLVSNTARLLDDKERDIFHDRFIPLSGLTPDQIYEDILKKLFNAEAKQRLKVVNIKNSKGELALRVGNADPFGLINIGDDAGFFKEVEKPESIAFFDSESDNFQEAIFRTINNKDSKINVLIGSRKFTEGWSSWRVSTMGLLNMGQGEGSQIIQLFGRGVRLKGKDFSLKRSTPNQRPKGAHLERLETLNVFGVNAGYMATFKEYLKEEGVTPSDELIELNFETRTNFPKNSLKTLALKDGYKDNQIKGFKRVHFPWLYEIPTGFEGVKRIHCVIDLYPKLEAMRTNEKAIANQLAAVKNEAKIPANVISLFDFDKLYLDLQQFKTQKSWSNLRVEKNRLKDFSIGKNDWYTLYMPASELNIVSFSDVLKLQDIFLDLLKDYTELFYRNLKNAYEGKFYDIVNLKEDSSSVVKVYQFEIENSETGKDYESRIKELQKLVNDKKIGDASKWNVGQMVAICFDRHLYYPLFSFFDENAPLKMRPLSFDTPDEVVFVKDLESFYNSSAGQKVIGKRSLYLLRNADSKSKGLGFALAGSFYPDFLLWLVDDKTGEQWLSFVDPKGIRNMDLSDPKLGLYREVKNIEKQLKNESLKLSAFILSVTDFNQLLNVDSDKDELESKNVLFMNDGGPTYLTKMFRGILNT